MVTIGCPYSFSYPVINLLHAHSIMNNYEFISYPHVFSLLPKHKFQHKKNLRSPAATVIWEAHASTVTVFIDIVSFQLFITGRC